MNAPDTQTVVYQLICFARAEDVRGLTLPGVEPGRTGIALESGEAAMVLAPVSASAWIGPEAEERQADLSWIGPRAIAHDTIIRACAAGGPVLPVPFGSIFSNETSAQARLCAVSASVLEAIDGIAGADEYGVHVISDRATLRLKARALLLEARSDELPDEEGARFFAEKRLEREVDGALEALLDELCAEAGARLEPLARASRSRDARVLATEEGRTLEAHWALLVDRERQGALLSEIDELNSRFVNDGLRFELTGPWPAYSFVPTLDTSVAV